MDEIERALEKLKRQAILGKALDMAVRKRLRGDKEDVFAFRLEKEDYFCRITYIEGRPTWQGMEVAVYKGAALTKKAFIRLAEMHAVKPLAKLDLPYMEGWPR